MGGPDPEIDLGLLRGFRFDCRPDCGLCCFASPAVTRSERSALLRIEPEAPFEDGDGRFSFVGTQGTGGACHFLTNHRCRVHPRRPFACREYPLLVHVGVRVQATLVLTCPGLDLSGLDGYADGGTPSAPASGLDAEVSTARAELAASDAVTWAEEGRRLFRSMSRRWRTLPPGDPFGDGWPQVTTTAVRPGTEAMELPDPDDGVEVRPLLFLPAMGVVALSEDFRGVAITRTSEAGSAPEIEGTYRPAPGAAKLDRSGERRLRGYLAYVARRDLLLWQRLAAGPSETGDLTEELTAELSRLAATVISRASVSAQVTGHPATGLSADAVDLGIRASDADWLDRPTLGRVL